MFTGLIETTGEVISFTPGAGAARLTIAAQAIAGRLRLGDSVAVSGVCLTALGIEPDAFPPRFSADLAEETIARTTLSRLGPGSRVNLELPTPAACRWADTWCRAWMGWGRCLRSIRCRREWRGAIGCCGCGCRSRWCTACAEKGSIAVDGVSLTIAGIAGDEAWIAILPHTYAATNLHTLTPGMGVNLEVDVLAKYAESREQAKAGKSELTVEYLLANGY